MAQPGQGERPIKAADNRITMEQISGVRDSGEGKPDSQWETENNAARDVGHELRKVRLKAGRALQDVAAELRIRADHLQAIEDGEFDRLPGAAYAVGFARSYANYLGVDAAKIVSAIRTRPNGRIAPRRLVFPEPMDESRMPKASVLLASAVVVALAYAGWYVFGGMSGDGEPKVAEVPRDLSVLAGLPSTEIPAQATTTPALEPRSTKLAVQTADSEAVTAVPSSVASGTSAAQPETPAASVPTTGKTMAEAAQAPAVTPAAVPVREEHQAPVTKAAALAPSDSPPSTPDVGDSPVVPATAQQDEEQSSGAETAVARNHATALGSPPSIVLRARNDTWIYVSGSDGDTLFEGVLRRGDSYTVPNRKGLVLSTADAGSLEIVVNGSALGAFGPAGSIRRQLSLDVDRLLSDKP